jgi:hypothetical protein
VTSEASPALTVAEAHARLRTHSDIQFDLPHAKPPEIPEWVGWLGKFFAQIGPYGGWIFWGLLAAGVGLLAWMIYVTFIRGRQSREVTATPEHDAAAWRPAEKVARALLAEADAMAAAGNYDAAARLLLHRSLEDIQSRRPKALRPALTSREIARIPVLPDLVRGAFVAMATPVERSLFGGRALARGDWEEARSAYGEFALAGSWK